MIKENNLHSIFHNFKQPKTFGNSLICGFATFDASGMT